MKMGVKIAEKFLKAIPDSGAALSVISEALVKKLNLNYTPTQTQQVHALNNAVNIIGVLEEAPLTIANIKIPINLRVVQSQKDTLLLGMDWYKKYQVILNTGKKTLDLTVRG